MKYTPEELKAVKLDGRYQDIGNLPSKFLPYAFKELYARPFTVHELRLVSKAAVLKEQSHLLRAIDLVISEDISEMSVGDFYYLLMWLRIHSLPKTPYVIDWHCEVPVYTEKAGNKRIENTEESLKGRNVEDIGLYSQEPCATHNSEVIHMSDVEIISLEDHFEALPLSDIPGVEFDFPRAKHLVQIQTALEDPELRLIVGSAQWIKGETLDDKIKILEAQADLDLFDTGAVLNEQVIHGIRETAVLTCRGCGVKRHHTLALDALSFFR